MDVTPLVKEGAQVIQSYAGGQFRVSGRVFQSSVVVMPDLTQESTVGAFESLCVEDFDVLMREEMEVDVVLLGTGERQQFLKPEIKKALRKKGLSVECMDTGAACRTYNVLMAEGRRVVAVLLPV